MAAGEQQAGQTHTPPREQAACERGEDRGRSLCVGVRSSYVLEAISLPVPCRGAQWGACGVQGRRHSLPGALQFQVWGQTKCGGRPWEQEWLNLLAAETGARVLRFML